MRFLVVVAALALAQAAEAVAPLASSRYAPLVVTDAAIPSARRLREVFDERFAAPRAAHEDRFAWDPRRAAPRRHWSLAAGSALANSQGRVAAPPRGATWNIPKSESGHGVSATRSPGMSTS